MLEEKKIMVKRKSIRSKSIRYNCPIDEDMERSRREQDRIYGGDKWEEQW